VSERGEFTMSTGGVDSPMPEPNRMVVVGASAGGVEVLREFVGHLPADLCACVCIVLHIPPNAPSALAPILRRVCAMQVRSAAAEMPLTAGTVVVAVADHHLLVGPTRVGLGSGPRENGYRPAVDVLFRSAARWWGPRTVAVVLSGALDDGAAGAHTVAARGGAVLVQDPQSAMYSGMPSAARAAVPDAVAGTPEQLAATVVELCKQPVDEAAAPPVDPILLVETGVAELDEDAHADPDRPGRPAGVACPDCHGAMFEISQGTLIRYRCRVGHAWSPETLLVEQFSAVEAALWSAIRSLEEQAAVLRKLGDRDGRTFQQVHKQRAAEADASAAVIRGLLREGRVGPPVAG
jgi:two-component system, chemotaxis family, protein-glutamate methylesterase/glutaminase